MIRHVGAICAITNVTTSVFLHFLRCSVRNTAVKSARPSAVLAQLRLDLLAVISAQANTALEEERAPGTNEIDFIFHIAVHDGFVWLFPPSP